MKVKKYIASSMPEVMKEIRKELGNDAVILQSKEIKPKGLFGRFKRKKFEVIAAKDSEPVRENKQKKITQINKNSTPQSVEGNNRKYSDQAILEEIKGLKKILELESEKSGNNYPINYQLAFQNLLEQDVEKTLAEELIDETLLSIHPNENKASLPEIKQQLQASIQRKLEKVSFQGITKDEKIVQFVGPTGVGKTTTIAKVAARLILQDKKRVAFITTDTYRMAAVEQLKTYARILNVPLEVAYSVEDYKQAIHELADYDVILVDTAGRNFRESTYVHQLKELSGATHQITNYLVLSLTAKPMDLQMLFEQFAEIRLTRVIFTKVDETSSYGSLLSLPLKNNIGIAYLTNGQDVPDDLIKPEPNLISEWMVKGYNE